MIKRVKSVGSCLIARLQLAGTHPNVHPISRQSNYSSQITCGTSSVPQLGPHVQDQWLSYSFQ
uniref:Uncharacterized protein n=1 Tax=Arundo donax TaxID=35708 RepID=A0A0A8XS23_ARUDO